MNIDEALEYAQNALERAFEDWLETERPSGDCESVHRQWDNSYARLELVDELQPVMALTAEVRRLQKSMDLMTAERDHWKANHDWALGEAKRLREENERLRAVLESACEKMKQCRYVEARSDMLQAIDAARGAK